MSIHKEINFEDEICEFSVENGWLFDDEDSAKFVRGLARYPDDVLARAKEAQLEAWRKLER